MNPIKKAALALASLFAMNLQAAPIFNIFELGIQPGQTAAYDEVGEHNIRTSLGTEPGTLAMYSVKQKGDPALAYMVEIYADQASYEAHRASEQYAAFLKASPTILTDHKKPYRLTPQFLGDRTIRQADRTRTNLVSVTLKPSKDDAFRAAVMPEMAQSLKVEPGVLAIYAGTLQDHPEQWFFFEVYESEAAYQTHRRTPHFQAYLRHTADLLQDKHFVDITPTLLMNRGGLAFSAR